MVGLRRIEELQDEARYHRDRLDLYKVKCDSDGTTNAARMTDLERRHRGAEARLRQALRENDPQFQALVVDDV